MPLPSWISIASGSSKSSLYYCGYFLALKWAGLCSLVWEGSDHPEVSIIYLSRSTKAPKRKLQANGPVAKKAKKKTSSSDSSEDSSEEEKAQGSLAKKAGKAGQGVGLSSSRKKICSFVYSIADSYLDLCFCSAVPAKRAILPQHPGKAAAKASESSSSEESSDDEEEDKKKKPVQV